MDHVVLALVAVALALVVLFLVSSRRAGRSTTASTTAFGWRLCLTPEQEAAHLEKLTGGPERCAREGHYGGIEVTHLESRGQEFTACGRCGVSYSLP